MVTGAEADQKGLRTIGSKLKITEIIKKSYYRFVKVGFNYRLNQPPCILCLYNYV